MDRPNDERNPAIPPAADTPRQRRNWSFPLAALGLILVSALASMGLAKALLQAPPPQTQKAEGEGKGIPARLFHNWPKPDFVVVLSAQQEGYLMPCGCSNPQVGGLERRYNFIQLLKARGWQVVAVDLGDVPQKVAPAKLQNVQGLIKYRYSMMALKEMGYLAVGIGENETAGGGWSLEKIEGEWAANNSQPSVLAGNLRDADNKFPFLKKFETQTVPGSNIKVGVTSSVGPIVAKNVLDPNVRFNIPSLDHINEQLQKMHKEHVDLPILLYHGWPTGQKEALACAQKFPDFPIILALTEEEEPPAAPISVDAVGGIRNYVFQLGHKGKYIGVLGVYRNGANFNFKYQLVKMEEGYATPDEQKANNPIARMFEDYTRELKNKDYLKMYNQTNHVMQVMNPVQDLRKPGDGMPHYIGSEECMSCHAHAYQVWSASNHSHAYKTLVDAKHPSLRQFDGECIVCHTVGFGYKTGFMNEKDTPDLINVGCESCHGPGSLHAANPRNKEWQERMNLPWLAARKNGNEKAKNAAIEKFCVTCHDIDNDVHWVHKPNHDPFLDKWIEKKIIHNNPPKQE
ncbi:MAG TPA: multiheme c-type cytochrome [Gemmataceae bacterium]